MRGTTGADLVAMLKAEIGDYSGSNTTRDAQLLVLLSNKQKQLASDFRWAFLQRRWDAPVVGAQQYVEFPTVDADYGETCDIDLDSLVRVEVYFSNVYREIDYGIGEEQYNAISFARGQQCDPIQRWRIASQPNEPVTPSSGANQFEVWPVPVTSQVVRFTGDRQLLPLEDDADTADLDDMLLVLGVASDQLIRNKQPDGQVKLAAFNRLLTRLTNRNQMPYRRRFLGGPDNNARQNKLVGITIAVH